MNLQNPVYAALTGPHAHLAEIRGNARRYPSAVAPFLALPDRPTEHTNWWEDPTPGRSSFIYRLESNDAGARYRYTPKSDPQ